MNLYNLSARYQQLLDQDEYTEEECQELQDIHGNLEDECISRGKYIRNLEAERKAVFDEIQNMLERLGEVDKKAEKQRNKLAKIMLDNKLPSITKSPLFVLTAKENPVSVDDYDKTAIPKEFWYLTEPKPVEKLDKTAVKKAIESGVEVPGARLVRKLKVDFK